MAPIRRVTEQLTLAEQNVIKSYDSMKHIHENFKVVAEAEAILRKGLAPLPSSQAQTHTHKHQKNRASMVTIITPAEQQLEENNNNHENENTHTHTHATNTSNNNNNNNNNTATLSTYIDLVDHIQEAMKFLRRNLRMRSAEVTLRQLELKQTKLLTELKEEIYRCLATGTTCTINTIVTAANTHIHTHTGAGIAGGKMTLPLPPSTTTGTTSNTNTHTHTDYQGNDPISLTLARRVKTMCEAMLRANDNR
jgi:hypothetical protein